MGERKRDRCREGKGVRCDEGGKTKDYEGESKGGKGETQVGSYEEAGWGMGRGREGRSA